MTHAKFALCINNSSFEAALELRKLYQLIPDPDAQSIGQYRVIDEFGEDYLFPAAYFFPLVLPAAVVDQIIRGT